MSGARPGVFFLSDKLESPLRTGRQGGRGVRDQSRYDGVCPSIAVRPVAWVLRIQPCLRQLLHSTSVRRETESRPNGSFAIRLGESVRRCLHHPMDRYPGLGRMWRRCVSNVETVEWVLRGSRHTHDGATDRAWPPLASQMWHEARMSPCE